MKRISLLLAAVNLIAVSAQAAAQTSVPLGADSQGRPTAAVTINGQGPFDLAIDTAAQRTGLGAELMTRLNLAPVQETGILHGATGARQMSLYQLDSLSLGGESWSDVTAIQMAHGGATQSHGGVLGANLFSGKRIEFDYENARLKVDAAGGGVPAGFDAVEARFVLDTFAVVPITIGGVAALGLVDTGAQHSLANPQLMRALGYSEDDPRLTARHSSGGATNDAATMRSGATAELRIGETGFDEIPVTFADLPVFTPLGLSEQPAIILGADVWRRMKAMAIDYDRGELQLRR